MRRMNDVVGVVVVAEGDGGGGGVADVVMTARCYYSRCGGGGSRGAADFAAALAPQAQVSSTHASYSAARHPPYDRTQHSSCGEREREREREREGESEKRVDV